PLPREPRVDDLEGLVARAPSSHRDGEGAGVDRLFDRRERTDPAECHKGGNRRRKHHGNHPRAAYRETRADTYWTFHQMTLSLQEVPVVGYSSRHAHEPLAAHCRPLSGGLISRIRRQADYARLLPGLH